MIRSIFTRVVMGVALLSASIAWSAWAYLHTVADPHRAERIAVAVLADPAARLELADPLADQIVEQTGLEPTVTPELRDAVVAVMTDTRITTNLTAAIGSAHARSFGVEDPRPATVDGGLLIAAVRDHLAGVAPDLAARIPTDLVGELTVPEVKLPFIAGLRTWANHAVEWCGAVAIGLFTFALLAGDRRYAFRRFGFWAVATGLFWAVGPRLIVFAARQFLPAIDATLAAGVGAATNTVTVAATVLVITGIAAFVLPRLVPAGPVGRPSPSPAADLRSANRRDRQARRQTSSDTSSVARPSSTVRAVPPRSEPPRSEPTTVAPPAATVVMPAVPTVPTALRPVDDTPPVAPMRPTTVDPPAEVDPWSYFGRPAVDPPAPAAPVVSTGPIEDVSWLDLEFPPKPDDRPDLT